MIALLLFVAYVAIILITICTAIKMRAMDELRGQFQVTPIRTVLGVTIAILISPLLWFRGFYNVYRRKRDARRFAA